MNSASAPLALTAHLLVLSSISFGGFPTVLPDVRHFVVTTHGWMTDQDFSQFFAIAQSIPGPNMILMMGFVGWKVWGIPGAIASSMVTFSVQLIAAKNALALHHRPYPSTAPMVPKVDSASRQKTGFRVPVCE